VTLDVTSFVDFVCIYQMNWVNSYDGFAVMTATVIIDVKTMTAAAAAAAAAATTTTTTTTIVSCIGISLAICKSAP